MIDREKVIKGLECCIESDDEACPKECPFYKECLTDDMPYIPVIRAALEPLKKQEALPIVYQTNEYTGLPMAHCPSCGEYLVQFHSGVDGKESRFCYYCGQEVKWE